MEPSVSDSVNAFLNEDSGNDEPDLSHVGDYSSHMEELFDEETEGSDSEEEGFVYNGADIDDTPAGYQKRLLDVLGSDHNGDDGSEFDVLEVENSLVYDEHTDDEPLVSEYSVIPYFLPTVSDSRSSSMLMTYSRRILLQIPHQDL